MFRYILSILMMFAVSCAALAQGWERVYPGSAQDAINAVVLTPDGGYLMAGAYNSSSRVLLIKTDAEGNQQWTKTYPGNPLAQANDVILTRDSGYAVLGWIRGVGNSGNNIYLLKTDAYGNLQWAKTFGGPYDDEGHELLELSDGSLVLTGAIENADGYEDLFLLKTDPQGNPVWQQMFGDPEVKEIGVALTQAANGDLVAAGSVYFTIPVVDQDIFVVRVSPDGQLVWQNNFGGNSTSERAEAVVATANGNFVLAGQTSTVPGGGAGLLLEIDGAGIGLPEWSEAFPETDFYGLALDNNGGFFVSGYKTITLAQADLYVLHTNGTGGILWETVVGKAGPDIGYGVVTTADGGCAAAGISAPFFGPITEDQPYLVKVDANGLVFTSYLSLDIFRDLNLNCGKDAGEPLLEDWIVKIQSPNFTRYAVADANGHIQLVVDTGTYDIQLITPNVYWQSCNASTSLSVTEFYDTVSAILPLQPVVSCPRNEVDIVTPVLRRCADNVYTVRYCNSGTVASENTVVEVQLDEHMTFTSSSLPPFMAQGNTYSFSVGTVDVGECTSFTVTAFLDCASTQVGQTHCVQAHITPDSFCNITTPWDGSIIEARAKCDSGQVVLSVYNRGAGPLNTTLDYVIVEDLIMLTMPGDPNFQVLPGELPPSQEKVLKTYPANGKTYRLITEQSLGYPGVSYPVTAAIEGCDVDPDSLGYFTMFPDGDGDAFIELDCQESSDTDYVIPNTLKRGHPKGYGVPHYVSPQTDLDYLIHFQNTGNDTVQQVIIRDTLSALLDPATVVPGGASHPYDFQLYGPGVVQFTIPNANLLPGSSANAGYVKFRVSLKPLVDSTECGLVVYNSAAIQFDFNAPVQSNQTFHTVCPLDSFVVVDPPVLAHNPHFPEARLHVYPNPFTESAQFELTGVKAQTYTLSLYDHQGRLLFNHIDAQPTFRLHRRQLPAGALFYRLVADGKPVASGKLLVR